VISTIGGIVALDGIGVIDVAILAAFVSWIVLASAGSALREMRYERVAAPRRERVAAAPRRERVAAPRREPRRPDRRTVARRAGTAIGTVRTSLRRIATVAAGGDP
jgi:hypothetical protein